MKNLKILLVEEYQPSVRTVLRIFEKIGLKENVTVVSNGQLAIDELLKTHFDIIITAMKMSVKNGFDAIPEIREMESYKFTPIIAFTALAMKGDREECLKVGATDYIAKPPDVHHFIERIEYYINYERHLEDFIKRFKVQID